MWSKAKYVAGSSYRGEVNRGNQEMVGAAAAAAVKLTQYERTTADLVDSAIGCCKFWGALHMTYCMVAGGETLASWAEGCMCHEFAMKEPTRWRREAAVKRRSGMWGGKSSDQPCPFKGCRSAELACSEHLRVLERAYDMEEHCIKTLLSLQAISDEDCDTLLKDMNVARSSLSQNLALKLGFWSVLPHLLCGLAHPDPAQATLVAKECCKQFDNAPFEHLHHRLSTIFLSPSGILRRSVDQLAEGVRLCDLPSYARLCVHRFRFVSVVERRIEASHAKLMRHVLRARRFGGAMASLNLRLPEISRRIVEDPQVMKFLLTELQSMRRKPYSLLVKLGLHMHPLVLSGDRVTHAMAVKYVIISTHIRPCLPR